MMNKKNLNRDKIAAHITNVMLEKHAEEEKEFGAWRATNEYAADVVKGLSDPTELREKLRNFKSADKEKDALLLIAKISVMQRRRRIILSTTSVAAAILFLSMVVWYGITSKPEPIIVAEEKIEVASETPKLVLLGAGTIELNKVSDTLTVGGMLKSADIVKIVPQASRETIGQLVVPSKCTYTLMLSDGSKVILNSNSQLRFPQTFIGQTREVELVGEGYFEVAKENDRPFIVKSGDYKVEVHGTKFNMNCYDRSMKTFLLEGSVSVSIHNGAKQKLRPMQMASVDGSNLQIEDVAQSDVYLSWLNDTFLFNALPLEGVVEVLEKWYGVRFDKSFNVNKPVFITGMFDRKIDFAELIGLIEKIAEIEVVNKEGIYHIKSKNM